MTAESFIAPSADAPRYVDAHNHLQDVRFADHRETIVREIRQGVSLAQAIRTADEEIIRASRQRSDALPITGAAGIDAAPLNWPHPHASRVTDGAVHQDLQE